VIASGTQHLVRHDPVPEIAFLDAAHPLVHGADVQRLLLLGWYRGERCILLDASAEADALPAGTRFEELRPLLAQLPEDQAAILTCARALMVWRSRHRHCGLCGAPTVARHAGHSLVCSSSECGAEFFPRIDPAVIVLVSDGEQVLLGRQAGWPPGRYSALAGFVEPGESLEDAVVREVREETGAQVTQLRYFASQPWPFPASLMIGFHAAAGSESRLEPIVLDGELEHARWYRPAELAADPAILPPSHSIARRLLESWYAGMTGAALG
jgi:NAD+ diphosphatase